MTARLEPKTAKPGLKMTIRLVARPLLWEDRQHPRVLRLKTKSNQFGGVSND
jgi:hypothetical protein